MNRGLNWAYFMFNNLFRKFFRYAQMTSFIFEMIIEFSAAIRNVNAQLVLMNRGLTSTYIMLIWMLLWDPLTYLFHWGTRVLVNVLLFLHLYCISGRRNVVSLFDGTYCETEFKTDNSCRYNGDFYIILHRWNKPIVSSIRLIYCKCLQI